MSIFMANGVEYLIQQVNGQRITRRVGDFLQWNANMNEIFLGNLPRKIFEDSLIPALATFGDILEFRLLMCYSGDNRGAAFIIYENQEITDEIINKINNYGIAGNNRIVASISRNVCKLIITDIPNEILDENIKTAIWSCTKPYSIRYIHMDQTKSVVVQYMSHREAALFRRELICHIEEFGSNAKVCWYKD